MAQFVNQIEAAKIVGMTVRNLQKLKAAGQIPSQLQDGRVVYDADDLSAFNERRKRKHAPPERRDVPMEVALDSLTSLVRTLSKMSGEFARTVLEPSRLLFQQARDENQSLRKRIAYLEQKQIDMLAQYEESQTLAHERRLETERMAANLAARKELLERFGPRLDTILGNLSIKGDVAKLVTSLEPVQLEAFKEAGLITEDQYDAVVALRAKLRRTKNAANGAAKTNGAANANG